MPVSRKSKNMKKSSKSKRRSKNIRRNKKTRKHFKKMSGGHFTPEIELFIGPYSQSVGFRYRNYIENIINFMSKKGPITKPSDLMNYFNDETNINEFKDFIYSNNNPNEFDKYINFINYVLDIKYGSEPRPVNIANLMEELRTPPIIQ